MSGVGLGTGGGGTVGGNTGGGGVQGDKSTGKFRSISKVFGFGGKVSPKLENKDAEAVTEKINKAITDFHEDIAQESTKPSPTLNRSASKSSAIRSQGKSVKEHMSELNAIQSRITELKRVAHRLHAAEEMPNGGAQENKENIPENQASTESKELADWKSIAKEVHQLRIAWKTKQAELKFAEKNSKLDREMQKVSDFFDQHPEMMSRTSSESSLNIQRSDTGESTPSDGSFRSTRSGSSSSTDSSVSSSPPSMAAPLSPDKRAPPSYRPPPRPGSPTSSVSDVTSPVTSSASVVETSSAKRTERYEGYAKFWGAMSSMQSRVQFLYAYRNNIQELVSKCLPEAERIDEAKVESMHTATCLGIFLKHQYSNPDANAKDRTIAMKLAIAWASDPKQQFDVKDVKVLEPFQELLEAAKEANDPNASELENALTSAEKRIASGPVKAATTDEASKPLLSEQLALVAKGDSSVDPKQLAKDFANQLKTRTALERQSLYPSEVADQNWSKPKKQPNAPNLMNHIHSFNNLSHFVELQMLKFSKEEDRIRLMKFFIDVERNLCDPEQATKELPADPHDSLAISAGLEVSSVYRLKTQNKLPEKKKEEAAELKTLTSPDASYKNAREYSKQFYFDDKKGVLDYCGMHLGDVTFASDGNLNIDRDKDSRNLEYNWEKTKMLGQSTYVLCHPDVKPNTSHTYFNLDEIYKPKEIYDENKNYERSLQLVPRK